MPAFKFKIKANSATSVTQQVADQIRKAIEGGRLKAGDRLPSEMEIADQLGMSRGVGKKAYRKLNGLGLFYNSGTGRVVGSGSPTTKRTLMPTHKSSAVDSSPQQKSAPAATKRNAPAGKKSVAASTKRRTPARSHSQAQPAKGSKK